MMVQRQFPLSRPDGMNYRTERISQDFESCGIRFLQNKANSFGLGRILRITEQNEFGAAAGLRIRFLQNKANFLRWRYGTNYRTERISQDW
jgi:hypothetical protein